MSFEILQYLFTQSYIYFIFIYLFWVLYWTLTEPPSIWNTKIQSDIMRYLFNTVRMIFFLCEKLTKFPLVSHDRKR